MKTWENKYRDGEECNVAPFDEVVQFVYRNKKADCNILEVGCGVGNNLNFLRSQGFKAQGIELSPTAAALAGAVCGSFTDLIWEDGTFDLVIDRASLSLAPAHDMRTALSEIHRVLKKGGKMLFTPYAAPVKNDPFYYTFNEIRGFLPSDMWEVLSAYKAEVIDYRTAAIVESHWRIVLQKA